MTHIEFLAQQEQRIEDALDQANHRSRQELAAQRDEIRRLAEIRRQQICRIEFKSAGATRKR